MNPVAYAFESLMINEFHGREFGCSDFVPSGDGYGGVGGLERSCRSTGNVPGSAFVDGDRYINESFAYYAQHKWRCARASLSPPSPFTDIWSWVRNLGIVIAFWLFFTFTYLLATAKIQAAKSKGEVLVFKRGYIPAHLKPSSSSSPDGDDEEKASVPTEKSRVGVNTGMQRGESLAAIHRQTKIFHWRDVCYDIKVKGGERRLLDHVDGWVKPGTLTALMVCFVVVRSPGRVLTE